MSVIVNLVVILVLLGVGLALPIAIGVYVYRDATRRGMNAAMWTLIALLAPSLIGFIIYLLIRGSYSDLECPNCKTPIKEDYVRCPKCGSKLRPSCPNCSAPVETDWTVCPRCATELPQTQTDTVVPVRRKDKSLGKILLIVILVPLLLIILMFFIFGMRMYNTIGSGGTSIVSAIAEEYLQDVDNEQISQWYNDCKESNKVHVLRHESLVATGEQEQVRYLIHMPELEDPVSLDFDNNAGFFQTKLRIDYSSRSFDKFDGQALLVLITCSGDDADLDLEIYCDDEKINYELTDSDVPIGLTDNVEKITEEWYSDGGRHNAVYVQPEVEIENKEEIEE